MYFISLPLYYVFLNKSILFIINSYILLNFNNFLFLNYNNINDEY